MSRRVVVALGGNALLRRGEPLTIEGQREAVRTAARALAPLVPDIQLVITHGNGPQVGYLALQGDASGGDSATLDVLGAQTEGMIGYLIEQELGNLLPIEQPFATLLTMVEVDPEDAAFQRPDKPIGPVYTAAEARRLEHERGWTLAADGERWRRVVPSPQPLRVFQVRPIDWLLDLGTIVICAGGGGIPTAYDDQGRLAGADVVVDKDRASALLAQQLGADLLVLATDVPGVFDHWGTDHAELVSETTPDALRQGRFAQGSMGPKVEAACAFVDATGGRAVIGALDALGGMVNGDAGTQIVSPA